MLRVRRLKIADRIEQQLGNYRLVRLLGQGGFAEVYLGEHIYLETQAAIKVLHTQLARDGIEQFGLEAKRIARLEHPHIVHVLDFGVEGTTPFLVMSYAPGGTLRQCHPKGARLPLPLIVQYVEQVADALQYAHEEKFIHRDVKPENMLLGRRNEVLLSDFGIATIVNSTTSLSMQAAVGTVPYMAPEQLQEHPRPASDQYALGVVVYEWLCGDRPFEGSVTEVAVKHLTMPPPSLHERMPEISPEVEQVVMTALAKDYKRRFGTVQAFARALEHASQVTVSHPGPLPREIGSPSQAAPLTTPNATNELSHSASTTEVVTPTSPTTGPTGMVASASSATRSTGISRRTVVIGLAGLAAASAGVSWLVASHPPSHLASNASSSGGSTGVNTNSSPIVTSLDVLTLWSGVELTNFQLINAAFTKKTGIKVNVETTRDLPAVLNTRIRGNNPPTITGSPGLAQLHALISQGKVVRLDTFLDMNQIRRDYSQYWINLASYNGGLYAVLPKANTKGTIWYNPKQFAANGYTVPQTWNDLVALSDKIASSGKYPWALGVESGASSGWPGADWIDQIYLSLNGPDMMDQWVAHKIKWTDPSVKNAFQMFGEIVNGTHYITGAPQSILTTNFQDASYLPYDSPPKAYMDYLGDFTAGFITAQFPGITAGTDYDFFPFPTINPSYAGAVTGGADMVFAMKDNSAIRQYMQYLSTAEAQEIWVRQGGASSINKSVPLSAYPNDVQRAAGKQLNQAPIFRSSPDDLMPTAMESAYWRGVLEYISNPSQLNSILRTLESAAVLAYSS